MKKIAGQIIAVAQMRASNNKIDNMKVVKDLVVKAASRGAQMIFLPEGCDYIGESRKETIELSESLSGSTVKSYCDLAKSSDIWLSVGGIHIKEESENKISNTHLIIDNTGTIKGKYEKTHLFDVHIPEQNIDLQESKYVQKGNFIHGPIRTPVGLLALGVCYDMRFPEFSLMQRKFGAQILTFPSAFTVATGLAHWHTLLKARAIESQCYVVASAQAGQHNSKRSSFGHALVVDPWGTVVAEVSEGTNIALAEIDVPYLEKVRKEMPVLNHRRKDLYSLASVPTSDMPRLTEVVSFPEDYVTYPFGQAVVPGSCIFLKTSASHAFVNKKPFTDGHVLVSPQKPVARFVDMNPGEVSDFSQAIALTLKVMRNKTDHNFVLIAIQDGESAGQTITHTHAHLVPGVDKPFVEEHEKKDTKAWRTVADMENEAVILREHTNNIFKYSHWLSSVDIPRLLELKKIDNEEFGSGSLLVPKDEVFLHTGNCFGVLAGNPILQGHVYVFSSKNISFNTLSPGGVSDLFLAVQLIQKELEGFFAVHSSTIFVRDSPEENNVCVHILPRSKNDLKDNDDIYELLLKHQPTVRSDAHVELKTYLKKKFGKLI